MHEQSLVQAYPPLWFLRKACSLVQNYPKNDWRTEIIRIGRAKKGKGGRKKRQREAFKGFLQQTTYLGLSREYQIELWQMRSTWWIMLLMRSLQLYNLQNLLYSRAIWWVILANCSEESGKEWVKWRRRRRELLWWSGLLSSWLQRKRWKRSVLEWKTKASLTWPKRSENRAAWRSLWWRKKRGAIINRNKEDEEERAKNVKAIAQVVI